MAQASGSGSGRRHEIRSRGCEIFVGGLSRAVSEETIEKLFSPYGEILELRLMKDQNGIPKGYCFVRYSTKEAANKAMKDKDGYLINGKKIGVAFSSDQDTLFFGNLCKAWSSKEFDSLIREAFRDVLSADLAFPFTNDGTESGRKRLNRGFAFVQFSFHAVMTVRAYRVATEPDFFLGGVRPAVEWAEKERELDPEELSKVKVAFVGNLPAAADEEYLKGLFEPFGKFEKVAISRKGNFPVGFVHFERRSDLEDAIRNLDGKIIEGPGRDEPFRIQVAVAKPMDRKRVREEVTSNAGRFDNRSRSLNGSRHDPPVKYTSKAPRTDGMEVNVVDPYEEAVISLPLAVKDRLLQIFRLGVATRYDIDIECISALNELPVAAAIAVIDEFMLSGGNKRNKGDYFESLIATVHQQDRRSGMIRPRLDYSRGSLAVPIEKSEILSTAYVRRPIPSASARDDRHPSPADVALARYASPPREPLPSRSAIRVSRKHSPVYEVVSSSTLVPRSRARLDPSHSLVVEHPSERPQYKFDPFTGQPYKFDPFTGEPIQPEAASSRRPGGYY